MPSDRRREANPDLAWWSDKTISRKNKNAPFCTFFHVQQRKAPNWRHYCSYRRCSAILEPAELRGTPMGPSDPPNAKGAAEIAPEMAILENRAFWVILAISPKTSHFGHFGQPSPNQGGSPGKKSATFGLARISVIELDHSFLHTTDFIQTLLKFPCLGCSRRAALVHGASSFFLNECN